ncbi:hypothetical protein KW541_17755 [Vibrio fluvialis]|nr:hypothetical protein [Vibrio fluvialis]
MSLTPNVILFSIYSVFVFFLSRPKYIFSPKCMVFAYYFIWFGLAPIFAERYSDVDVGSDAFFYAYIYLSSSYYILFLVSEFALKEVKIQVVQDEKKVSCRNGDIISILILTCVFLFLYVQVTGGVTHWINNIDRAFLTRQGAGVYYLGFSLLFPLLVFLISSTKPNFIIVFFLLMSILILSPFIGSKQKIIFVFLLVFYRKIYFYPVNIHGVIKIVFPVVGLFILGNYFRNSSWMTWSHVLSYSLNYFDTLDSLLIVINDFEPFSKMTTFLPFNKFYNLFTGDDRFFDVSAYLTSIYFPNAWDIRATVQFPVEADFYLSLGYFFGLPLLVALYYVYCRIYEVSIKFQTPIVIFIWMNLFVYILSHLRGGVLLWTDFYLYPFLGLVYVFFKRRVTYE